MHCTHTKTAEQVETMSGLGLRNSLLHGGDDPPRERCSFGGKHVPDKPNTLWIANWTGPCIDMHVTGRCLIASIGRVYYRLQRGDCTPRTKSDIYDCLVAAWIFLHYIIFNLLFLVMLMLFNFTDIFLSVSWVLRFFVNVLYNINYNDNTVGTYTSHIFHFFQQAKESFR